MNRYGVFSFLLLLLLAACGESHEQMLRQLEELERMNRADSVMLNDTLAEQLTQYFDRHGDSNERMRAHYILGRTYADMGEAPAALNAYLDAADCADTTTTDCDFRTLSRVFSQMAWVYYQQNLMASYLQSLDNSIYSAWLAQDTLQAFNNFAYKILAYDRLKQNDSVISLFDSFFYRFCNLYGKEKVAPYCILPIRSLLEEGKNDKANYYLTILEKNQATLMKQGIFSEAVRTTIFIRVNIICFYIKMILPSITSEKNCKQVWT